MSMSETMINAALDYGDTVHCGDRAKIVVRANISGGQNLYVLDLNTGKFKSIYAEPDAFLLAHVGAKLYKPVKTTTVCMELDRSHGREYRLSVKCPHGLGIDDLDLDHWHIGNKGAYVNPGREDDFIRQAQANNYEISIDTNPPMVV